MEPVLSKHMRQDSNEEMEEENDCRKKRVVFINDLMVEADNQPC